MTGSLALRVADKNVKSYQEKFDVLAAHHQAMERQDCDDFLRLGIDAYHWLVRADEAVHAGAHSGALSEQDYITAREALKQLYLAWLAPCERAEKWAEAQAAEHIAEYQQCCRDVRAVVNSFANEGEEELPDEMARLRNSAIDEHRNGQTAARLEDE